MKVVTEFDLSEIDLEVSNLPDDVRHHLLLQIARQRWDSGDAYWEMLGEALDHAEIGWAGEGDIGIFSDLGAGPGEFCVRQSLEALVLDAIERVKDFGLDAHKDDLVGMADHLRVALSHVEKAINSLEQA
ncbi:MAG: hypothetical protein M0Q15_15890 [Nevskia sp.]|jgi:hypothetical protein|nr:hypothetical protein [Nevskia sp.]